MFKQARNNSFIYILTKGQNPVLETGVIQTVSQPRMTQFTPNQQNPYQYPQPMVVDIVANVGQDKRNLNGLPAENDIADFNGNVVVTLDKDKIANEIKVLYKEQESIYWPRPRQGADGYIFGDAVKPEPRGSREESASRRDSGLKEHCGAAYSTYAATDGAISAVYESDFRKREHQII